MSRNLCQTYCAFCPAPDTIKLVEEPRQITGEEACGYFEEYEGLVVANAECTLCEAKYLAWVHERHRVRNPCTRLRPDAAPPFFDLSFRSTFNDEPGDEDMPTYRVEQIITYKKTPWGEKS